MASAMCDPTRFDPVVWRYRRSVSAILTPPAPWAMPMAPIRCAIVIPCHRAIGADGSLTGYRWGLEVKRRLLDQALIQSRWIEAERSDSEIGSLAPLTGHSQTHLPTASQVQLRCSSRSQAWL